MNFLSNKYFLIALRIIVGGFFVYASLGKLLNQEDFARAIWNYKFLPDIFINIFAIVMPYLEFIAGILLIFGIYKRGSSFIISFLLIIFLISLIQAYARGLDISCGCFSLNKPSEKGEILQRIIEDIFLLIGSLIIFLKYNSNLKTKINQETQQ